MLSSVPFGYMKSPENSKQWIIDKPAAEIAEKIKPLGADVVINSSKADVAEILAQEEQKGTPVSVSMDCLCGETLGKSLPYMARGGYWVVISTLAGTETNLLLRPLLTKGLHLVGSMLRNRTPAFKAALLAELVERVWPKIEDGTIKPSIYKVLPMAQAEEAQAILERGENVGKVVLTLQYKKLPSVLRHSAVYILINFHFESARIDRLCGGRRR